MHLDEGRGIILRNVGRSALFGILVVGGENGRFGLGRARAGSCGRGLRWLGEERGELRSKRER